MNGISAGERHKNGSIERGLEEWNKKHLILINAKENGMWTSFCCCCYFGIEHYNNQCYIFTCLAFQFPSKMSRFIL